MFQITGVIQDYAWGSVDGLPTVLGTVPTGDPQAEYWLGAHPHAPARTQEEHSLDSLIEADPTLLGEAASGRFGGRLPYLLKILSVERALSLQAHPTREQAEEGFEREENAGIDRSAPDRNYRDSWPKPESLVALTKFDGLYGFRPAERTKALFDRLNLAALSELTEPLNDHDGIARVFLEILDLTEDDLPLVHQVSVRAGDFSDDETEFGDFCRTAMNLAMQYPEDPGVLAALMMNHFTLQPGEGLYIAPGTMHAYLHGMGVEILANSDNVLRGGLTSKHVDVDELARVVSFWPSAPELVPVHQEAPSVRRYLTPTEEFGLFEIAGDAELPEDGCGRILLVVEGAATLTTKSETLQLCRGEAAFVPATDHGVRLSGATRAFLAAPGR